jgi:hypothetical protein
VPLSLVGGLPMLVDDGRVIVFLKIQMELGAEILDFSV